ncbi:MAG: hypothetical protein DRO88_03275 [Promethearchaeia archaeon]|nr:MAG: hypothetical protein DRO88_03275 [Candidatus Lokiarchaeia archaeon]
MNPLLKRKLAKAEEKKEQELHYLLDSFKSELEEMQKKLDNLKYQIEFFGATPELIEKKKDCKVMMQWIQSQFEEIKQSLSNHSKPLSA